MPRDQLAALVTAARKRAGHKTVYAWHKATGMSVSSIYDIESGRTAPTVENLERIMDAIGWDVVVMFKQRKKGTKR